MVLSNDGLVEQSHALLPVSKFDFWYDAIIANDHALVRETLYGVTEEEKFCLLNGKFIDDKRECKQASMTNIWSNNDRQKFVKMEVC